MLLVKRYMNSMKIVENMTFNNETIEQINENISPFNMKISEKINKISQNSSY